MLDPRTFRYRRFVSLMAAWLLVGGGAFAADLHVPDMFPTIQAAIDAAAEGDRVLVGPGTYVERLDFGERAITVESTNGPAETILDGDGGGSVVRFGMSGEGAALCGFTITNGTGTRINLVYVGGGILTQGASPRIEGNVIQACEAEFGGAIACLGGSSATLRGNELRGNEAIGSNGSGKGGGVYVDEGSRPEILGNEFHRNWAVTGGSGVAVVGLSAALIESNRFERDRPSLLGGTVDLSNASGSVVLNNDFAPSDGKAIHVLRSQDVRIEGNSIGGEGQFAGGFYARRARGLELFGNTFFGNQCYIWQSPDVRIAANYHESANMYLDDCSGARMHGCVFVDTVGFANQHEFGSLGSDVEIAHCTFLSRGEYTGGVFVAGGGTVDVVNSIVWGESDAFNIVAGSNLTVRNSVVRGGWPGEGNLDRRPQIVRRAGDFHLTIGSPCIDAGVPVEHLIDFDIDKDPRELDDAPDIGADEFRLDIAARYGTVGGGEVVLTVNGSAGDFRREVKVERSAPLVAELRPASAGPDPARYAIYAWLEEPDATTLRLQPFGLGWTVFPTPLQPDPVNQPVAIWNTLGYPGKLGRSREATDLAPVTLIDRAQGIGITTTFTLQGFVEDADSRAAGPVSVTNAVVVRVQ